MTARTRPPLSVILTRILAPIGLLAIYWWLRLHDLTSPNADAAIGWEWAGALAATLVGLTIVVASTKHLIDHLTEN